MAVEDDTYKHRRRKELNFGVTEGLAIGPRPAIEKSKGHAESCKRRIQTGDAGESKHGDVVFLAEGLRGRRNSFSGFGGDGLGAVKAVEFALWVDSFEHAVRDEGEEVAGGEPEEGFGVGAIGEEDVRRATDELSLRAKDGVRIGLCCIHRWYKARNQPQRGH